MNFLKAFFGGTSSQPEEEKKQAEARNFDILKYDGKRALQTGQFDYAIQCFRKALEMKDDLEVHDYLSQALIHHNELEAACEELQVLATAQPDNVQIQQRMAHVFYLMDEYGRMLATCEKALQLAPEMPELYYLAARAYIGQANDLNAVALLTKALALKEDYYDANLLRGETLLRMGDVAGAEADANLLMSQVPDNEDILMLKAQVMERREEHAEALALYNKVVNVNPFRVDAFRERGAVKMAMGDKEGAAADMRMVLELNPAEAEAVNGDYTAEGREDIQRRMEQAYKRNNPYGF